MKREAKSYLAALCTALGFSWMLADSLATVIEPLTAYLLAGCFLMACVILLLAFMATAKVGR